MEVRPVWFGDRFGTHTRSQSQGRGHTTVGYDDQRLLSTVGQENQESWCWGGNKNREFTVAFGSKPL